MTTPMILTLEDANRRLPLVRAIVRDVVSLKADILSRRRRLQDLHRDQKLSESDQPSPYTEEVDAMERAIDDDERRIDAFASELMEIGAWLVDAESGLVEFDSQLEGQPIRLSWQPGEPEVSFWRYPDEQPRDRKPLAVTQQT